MGWQHVQGDCIAVRQEKTDKPLLIPIDPAACRARWRPAAHQHDVSDDRIRQAVQRRRVRQLVSPSAATRPDCRSVRRMVCASSRPRGSLRPDAASTRSKPSPDIAPIRRSRPTSAAAQQGAAGASGKRAGEGRARTKSTQHGNPSLPNSEKAMTIQRDILRWRPRLDSNQRPSA